MKKYNFNCVICGKEFTASKPNAKYCCAECKKIGQKPILVKSQRKYLQRQSARRKEEKSNIVAYCKICGSPIPKETGRLKYCSNECVSIAKNLAVKRHYAKRSNQVDYCSKQYKKTLIQELTSIKRKSTLDNDILTLTKDGEKLGLKSYDYGKYAHLKGL